MRIDINGKNFTTLGGGYLTMANVSDLTGDGTFVTSIQSSFGVAANGSARLTGTLSANPNRYCVLSFGNPGRLLRAGDAPGNISATYGGAFRFTAGPEPMTAGMLAVSALPLLRRRR